MADWSASVCRLGGDRLLRPICLSWMICFTCSGMAAAQEPSRAQDPRTVAEKVDSLIEAELTKLDADVAPLTNDEDFLRRVTLDLVGSLPNPTEVTLFGLDPDSDKRQKVIDRLLASDDFARNLSQYWREVIFSRATDPRSRISQRTFEQWMTTKIQENAGWDEIATEMVTATGDILENGATAIIMAQGADTEDVAAEMSRVFLGIQIQCANCHDHPTDSWKREQFHQLAAFFPRIRLQPKQDTTPRSFEVVSVQGGRGRDNGRAEFFQNLRENPERTIRFLDRNRDGKLQAEEFRNPGGARIVQLADSDKDGALSVAELKALPVPMAMHGRGSTEHFMPNLEDPQDRGTKIDPVFFVNDATPGESVSDQDRRKALASYLTSRDNPWFARAIVNRVWNELLGEGFYTPVDDIGPEREARYPLVLDALSNGFAESGYDVKWLFKTIANTRAYQRTIRVRDPSLTGQAFASAHPTRLRADQLYDAFNKVFGFRDNATPNRGMMGGGYRFDGSLRGQFSQLFGFDPSTPQEEITGTVPQALFMMNSPQINGAIRGNGQTRLARILNDFDDNTDAVTELYLLVLSREPTERELRVCLEYTKKAPTRQEAFEDMMWSLLNSAEFQTKR